jgi:hypothetical protein
VLRLSDTGSARQPDPRSLALPEGMGDKQKFLIDLRLLCAPPALASERDGLAGDDRDKLGRVSR